jgi:hypothetical protein
MTPGVLLVPRGRGVALAQRLRPLAGHVILAALRKARCCNDRQAECEDERSADSSAMFVKFGHDGVSFDP